MRLKAIPMEAVAVVKTHPALFLAGGAIAGYGIYKYMQPSQPVDDTGTDTTDGSTTWGYQYAAPASMGGGGGGGGGDGGSSIVDSLSNPQGALLDFEILKESHDYDIASRQLDLEAATLQVNKDISEQSIAASNWAISAGLAQAFMQSGAQYFAGNVGGEAFGFIASGTPYTGKNQNQTQAMMESNYQTFINSPLGGSLFGSSPNELQSQSGSLSTTPYGSAGTPNALQSGGSNSVTGFISGSVSSGGQSAAYSPSPYQTPSYGGSGGGTTGGTSTASHYL